MSTKLRARARNALKTAAIYAAVGIGLVASAYVPLARIDVTNESSVPVKHLRISGGTSERALAELAPGDTASFWLRTSGDSALRLAFDHRGIEHRTGQVAYIGARPPHRSVVSIDGASVVSHDLAVGWFGVASPWPWVLR